MSDELMIETLQARLAARERELAAAQAQTRELRARLEQAQRAEEELSRQTETLREQAELLNLAHDAIFVRTIDGTIRYWNDGATQLYGWPPEQAIGQKTSALLCTIFPGSFDQVFTELQAKGCWEGELVQARRDGAQVLVESRWSLRTDATGNALAVMEINTDITERKQAEARVAAAQEALRASQQQLRALSRRLVDVAENERRTISRELHDVSSQALTAVQLALGTLQRHRDCSEDLREGLEEVKRQVDAVLQDLHRLASDLRPISLDRFGLGPALRQLLGNFEKQCSATARVAMFGMDEEDRLPPEVETASFRIVQEALTNVTRHAGATHVGVVIQRDGGQVQIVVEDNGHGFDPQEAQRRGRLGLVGMRERAEAIGGTMEVESKLNAGTTIIAVLPL